MANPSVTYTFTNGTTADGSQVSQNFADLIAGMTDGTKSFSIDALTVGGTALFNGAVTLGNASGDDITFTGSLASAIPVKTNSTYDIGDSTHALRVGYMNKIQGGTTAGCAHVGRTDGGACAAGEIGELLGTARNGTNSSTKSTTSTTSPGNGSFATVASITLNKGVYILSWVSEVNNSTNDVICYTRLSFGGTTVNTTQWATTIKASYSASTSGTFPVVVAADTIAIAITMQSSAAVASATHEIWAIRVG